jgi:hypothetical protein
MTPTQEAKLDQLSGSINSIMVVITSLAAAIAELKKPGTVPATPAPAPEPVKAYDRPSLGIGEIVPDGVTVNADGSIWGRTLGTSGPIIRIYFGYISPKKTPEIFNAAKEYLGTAYADWEAAWRERPYGIYRADPREVIASGQMNFVLFGMLMGAPARDFIQD